MPSSESVYNARYGTETELRERKQQLRKIKKILREIPSGSAQCARYDTDDKLVLSIFRDEKTWDIEIDK